MNKRNIYILYAIALLQGMVFYAPVATLYRQAAGIGIFQITLIESISLVLMILLEIPWGWAADRIGYRRTMLVCCGLYFVSKVVFWKADSFSMFLLERILLSVVCAGLSGVDSSMLYLSCGETDSHRVFSIYNNLQQMGLIAAAGTYALWIGENYRLAGFLTVISHGAAALLALGLREVKAPDIKRNGSLRSSLTVLTQQLGKKERLLLLLAVALVNETHQTVTVFLNQLQYSRAGMDTRAISLAYIAVSITGLAGGFSARLCAKTGARRMGSLLMLASALCCLVLAVTARPMVSVLAVLGLRGCYSLLQPLHMELQNRMITTSDRATALSMNAVLLDGVGIFLNLIFGYIAERNLTCTMLFGGAVCIAGTLLFRRSQQT